jgi:parallel beta-helix repeat protein
MITKLRKTLLLTFIIVFFTPITYASSPIKIEIADNEKYEAGYTYPITIIVKNAQSYKIIDIECKIYSLKYEIVILENDFKVWTEINPSKSKSYDTLIHIDETTNPRDYNLSLEIKFRTGALHTHTENISLEVTKYVPKDIKVDNDFSNLPEANYSSIQEAINNAKNSDNIIVYSGIYEENLRINKKIKLFALEGPNNTIIIAKNGEKDVILVESNGVTISNFTIIGSFPWKQNGIHVSGKNNTIIKKNNIKDLNFGSGILLSSSNNNIVQNNLITKCGSDCIKLEYASNNRVTNNKIKDTYGDGLGVRARKEI